MYYEGAVAKCALERAFLNGETNFRKPASCHLFPIRIRRDQGREHMYIERIRECEPGYNNGAAMNIRAAEFLREPLTRVYGESVANEIADEERLPSSNNDINAAPVG